MTSADLGVKVAISTLLQCQSLPVSCENGYSAYIVNTPLYKLKRGENTEYGYEGWVAKSVARQLATAVLWVRIQTSLKNHKWAT